MKIGDHVRRDDEVCCVTQVYGGRKTDGSNDPHSAFTACGGFIYLHFEYPDMDVVTTPVTCLNCLSQ